MERFVIHLKSSVFVKKTLTNSKEKIAINWWERESSLDFVLFIELDIGPCNSQGRVEGIEETERCELY